MNNNKSIQEAWDLLDFNFEISELEAIKKFKLFIFNSVDLLNIIELDRAVKFFNFMNMDDDAMELIMRFFQNGNSYKCLSELDKKYISPEIIKIMEINNTLTLPSLTDRWQVYLDNYSDETLIDKSLISRLTTYDLYYFFKFQVSESYSKYAHLILNDQRLVSVIGDKAKSALSRLCNESKLNKYRFTQSNLINLM